jgi:hypothetical protein
MPAPFWALAQFIDHSTHDCEAAGHEVCTVTGAGSLLSLSLLLGLASSQADPPRPSVQRLVVERQWILRVPVRPQPLPQGLIWVESKGPKCIPTGVIRGAMLSGTDHVDLVLPHQRIRANFDEDCPALDFYAGFYLKTDDHRVCARRDSVHSRMGGSCRIKRFRTLKPKLKD